MNADDVQGPTRSEETGIQGMWPSRLRLRRVGQWLLSRLLLSLLVFSSGAVAAVPGEMRAQTSGLLGRQPRLLHLVEKASFPIALDAGAGEQAEIFLESSAPGVEFAVLAPNGRQVEAVAVKYPEWLAISFPVAESGQYRIVARTVPAQVIGGSFAVRVFSLSSSAAGAADRRSAEHLFSAAQSFSHSPNAGDLHRAIVNYRRAGTAWAKADNQEGQVLALAGEAGAWLGLSEHDKAVAALNRAMGLCAPTSYWQAWLANLEAQVFLDRWDNELGRKEAEESLQLSRVLQDDWLIADALADRGESEYLTHDPSASPDIEESLRLARESAAIGTMARALRCNAWTEKDQGHLTRAIAGLDQARGYFHRSGDVRAEMQALSTLATIGSTSGDPYSSLLRHTKLAALMRQSGAMSHYAVLLANIGADYAALNRTPDAILYYRQALAAFRSTHHMSGEALVLSELCSSEVQEGHLNEAVRDCRAAATIVEQFHDPKRTATSIWRLGKVQLASGQTALATGSFQKAVELSESVHDTRFTAQALLDWGDDVAVAGKQEEAKELFERALTLSVAAENVSLQLEARYRIAQMQFQSGQDEDAKQELEVALESIEVMRRAVGNADLQAAYFAQVRKCHDLYIDILMHEQERDPASGAAARALEVSESGRALTLLDALALRDSDARAERKAGDSLQMRGLHLAVEQTYDQRLKLMIEGAGIGVLDANAARLTAAVDSLERAEDEQKATLPPAGPTGRTLTAAQIAAASDRSHSTLVEYVLGTRRSYVWVIDGGKVESYVLPAGAVIASKVDTWRTLVTARIYRPGESFDARKRRIEGADRELPQVAADLSCTLFGPFLRRGMGELTIVPDGELYLLPFAALPANGCLKARPLLLAEEHKVLLTPSLSVFLRQASGTAPATFRGDVAVFANPVFDRYDARVKAASDVSVHSRRLPVALALPSLPGTRREADGIAEAAQHKRIVTYEGFNATLQSLFSPSLSDYRIVHLATHGIFDQREPGFSGIVLTLVDPRGQPVFGYLKAHDIASLDLHSDLVVLSACDSAAGDNLSGEGLMGLNHAFLSAGAKRVVSTLWSVDDTTSADFMKSFYTKMLREHLGPTEALRRSQLEIKNNPATKAPYYWAAFTLTSTID